MSPSFASGDEVPACVDVSLEVIERRPAPPNWTCCVYEKWLKTVSRRSGNSYEHGVCQTPQSDHPSNREPPP